VLINFLKQSWLVILSSLIFGLLVSGIYGQLKPKIDEQARLKLEREMMKAFMKEAAVFESALNAEKTQYFIGKNAEGAVVGYAIEAEGGGFADKIRLLVAIDKPLEKLMGIGILKSSETPGFGDKIKETEFKDQFSDSPAGKLKVLKEGDRSVKDEAIIAITGATISSDSVVKIVNNAVLELKKVLGNK